ncbi:MAG: hypothetical protein WA160_03980 [Pseudobdellovibrio sp.]
MRNQIVFILFLISINTSFAQGVSTLEAAATATTAPTEGLHFSIFKANLIDDIKAYGGKYTPATTQGKVDETLGFSVGLINMPIQKLGYTTNLAYLSLKDQGSNLASIRLDGNVGYADYVFGQLCNLKGGLNLSKFISGDFAKDLDPSVGGQASFGVAIIKNVGVDIGYTIMRQTKNINGVDLDYTESGFEIGLGATF